MITNLMQLRQACGLTSRQVADEAGLLLRVEYLAEIGALVTAEDASKLAAALSKLAGKQYPVEQLGLAIKKEDGQ